MISRSRSGHNGFRGWIAIIYAFPIPITLTTGIKDEFYTKLLLAKEARISPLLYYDM